MKNIFIVLLLCPFFVLGQSIERKNILIEKFDNSAKAEPYIIKIWEEILRAEFISLHQSIYVVDRSAYDLIKKERKNEKEAGAGTNKQGVTLGAEYLLTGDVLAATKSSKRYLEKTETYTPPATKENPKPKPEQREIYAIKCNASVEIKIKMIDIGSGEIKLENTFKASFEKEIADTDRKDIIDKAKYEALNNAFRNVPYQIRPEVVFLLNPKYFILDVTKGSASSAKKILLAGGKKAGFPNIGEIYLNVYESIEENIDGQKLSREILLGNVKAEDIYDEVSEAIVIKGGDAIAQKIKSGAKLYCKFEKIPIPGEFY